MRLDDSFSCLTQWDTGRKIILEENETCDQVHFSNKSFGTTIDVKTYQLGDDLIANIPDELLQSSAALIVHCFLTRESGETTTISKSFPVRPRNKPLGYIYNPDDQTRIKEFNEFVDDTITEINGIKDNVEATVVHQPIIQNGTWWVWSFDNNDYIDTGIEAQGPKGEQGIQGNTGDKGDPARINGVNTITIKGGTNINLEQTGTELIINNTNQTIDIVQTTGQSENSVMSQKAITDKIELINDDLDNLIIKPGNVLIGLTSEHKVISTNKDAVVFYNNDSYSTFFIPIKNGDNIYVASTATSGYSGIKYAFVDSNRIGVASTYVSTNLYASTHIEITSPIEGYFAFCCQNESVSRLSVSIGELDTSDKKRLSNDVILQNTHLEQVKIYVKDNIFINKLNDKVLYPIGDSITYGSGLLQADKKWWNYVAERYGMIIKYVENSSLTPSINGKIDAEVGRAFTKDGSTSTRFTQRIKEIPSDADVIIIFGGTNDFGLKNVEIGSMDDAPSDANGGISLYSALKFCGEYLSQNHSDKIIIFMTPLPRNSGDEGFNAKDSNGKRLIDYAEAIKTMCRCFGFYCIDLNNIGEFYVGSQTWIDENTKPSDTGNGHGDGLHPNATCTEKFTKNGIFPVLDSFFVSVQK